MAYLCPACQRPLTAIAALPDGKECYRARVRSYTTVDRDGRAVHKLGLEEMERIQTEMRAIAQQSFGTTDLPQLIERLRSDSQYTFRSREDLIGTAERVAGPDRPSVVPRRPRRPRQVLCLHRLSE
jgi:uncharacterized protein (DUF885 family)